MGYFERLQKRARYYDADAGEYRWGSLAYTGSRTAGVDYVNSEGLCVVYSTKIHYSEGETGLYELSVSTNFVNPHSSADPSTAWCYLYLTDPTLGGDASVASPPPGFWGMSVPQDFEASDVGSYLTFSFTGMSGMPAQVWLWFACDASYGDFGSNQIYHYATGNYDSALGTGTRTPAVSGSFIGSAGGSGSGGESGEGRYSLVDSGSYTGIFAETVFSYTRSAMTASRSHLSFAGGGSVFFHLRGDGEAGSSYLSLYLSDSPGFDCYTGMPTGSIIAQDRNRSATSFFYANASPGQDYYLFAVLERSSLVENELTMSVKPQSWSYELVDMGSYPALEQQDYDFSMYMEPFQTGRMELSFDYQTQIDFAVADPGDGSFAHVWLSEREGIRSSNGQPTSSICSLKEGDTRRVSIEKGKTYYVFAIYSGGSAAGAVSFSLLPPPVLWYEGDYAAAEMLEGEFYHSAALSSAQFSRIELSFAHTGTARIWTEGSYVAQSGQRIEAFFCDSDGMDVSEGYPASYLEHAYGKMWSDTADLAFNAEVVAGKSYWLYIKNTLQAEGYDTSCGFELYVQPPESWDKEYYFADRGSLDEIYKDRHELIYNSRYTICCYELSHRYRGEAAVNVTMDGDYSTGELRCYITREKGADKKTGMPAGEILAMSEEGESMSLRFQAEPETSCYLYFVCPEVYGSTRVKLDVELISPPQIYFSVSDRAEYYAIADRKEHFSAPGMSGVCLLELSFGKSGLVSVSSRESGGKIKFLRGFVSDTPFLDGLSGMPCGNVLAEGSGSADSPELSLSFYANADESYYLFVRDDSVYGNVSFTLFLSMSGGGHVFAGGKALAASPWIYTAGKWHKVRTLCHVDGKWHNSL